MHQNTPGLNYLNARKPTQIVTLLWIATNIATFSFQWIVIKCSLLLPQLLAPVPWFQSELFFTNVTSSKALTPTLSVGIHLASHQLPLSPAITECSHQVWLEHAAPSLNVGAEWRDENGGCLCTKPRPPRPVPSQSQRRTLEMANQKPGW